MSAIVASQNCSTYNPCGKYGYCVDNSQGDWECQCKFWWNGTYCNQQTSSGIQVIILGVLLGILIIVFYGLSFFCSIRREKHQPKTEIKEDKQNHLLNRKLTQVALINVKQSARFSSCTIVLLMLIIIIGSLITKWLLLQPIHNELVNKYNQNESIYYERNTFCNLIDLEDFNMVTFPITCFLILLFIIFSQRTSCMRGKCKGYFAPILPLDFYIHIKRKFAAVIFAIIADELLNILNEVFTESDSSDQGIIFIYLIRIKKVLVIGFRYYPILSAVYIDSLLTLTCASFYTWFNFSISIFYEDLCQSNYYPSNKNYDNTNGTDIIQLFKYYGTGQNLVIIQLFTDIPRYICWSYILIKLPMLLIDKIFSIIKHRKDYQSNHFHLTREERIFLHSSYVHSIEMSYVRNLFRSINQPSTSRSFLARLIPKFIYQWRDDFRFSSRIFCIYSSVFLLLYFITEQACILILPKLAGWKQSWETFFSYESISDNPNDVQSIFPLPDLVCPYLLAIFTAYVITIIQLFVLLRNIRRNLLQIYRGDDSEIPKRNQSNYLEYSTGNFHFAGFFIGYLVWGYVLTFTLAFVILVSIASFITFGSVKFLEDLLTQIIPTLLLILFKYYINKILARYVFLQDYGEILAINNRRILMIFLYFNFFLDSFLGLILSIIRIIKSVIGGCLYMSRLDYSPFGRKLETFDDGFTAYCGFIHIEAVHRNPIMLAVASYLYSRMKAKQYLRQNSIIMDKNKSIRKWHLAILLIQNSSLRYSRKHVLKNKKMSMMNEIKIEESSDEEIHRRPSLVSEIDLRNIWHKN